MRFCGRMMMTAVLASLTSGAAPVTCVPTVREGEGTWWRDKLARNHEIAVARGEVDLVMLGDSITHYWEIGEGDDTSREVLELERRYSVVNGGFGGAHVENILWDIVKGGELDGYRAKVVSLMLGTNNRNETPEEIVAGIDCILAAIREKQPDAHILLTSCFPRGQGRCRELEAVNALLAKRADEAKKVYWFDIYKRFLNADGETLNAALFADRLHPSAAGYRVWLDALLAELPKHIAKPLPSPTKVMFFFDTEDFTCDESSDVIRETAKILTEEGVVGEYNIVGFLARELVRYNRRDVIDALKPHAIGTQTLGHSFHPTVCEMTDMADARIAYRNVLRAEAEGVGMLKAAFNLQHVDYAVPPGNSWSYMSLYAFADLGMTFYGGCGFTDNGPTRDRTDGIAPDPRENRNWDLWYCNLRMIPYPELMAIEALIPPDAATKERIDSVLDKAAARDAALFYMHPHIGIKKGHWDGPNYRERNRIEWDKWIQIENRPKADTEAFYRNFRAFVRRVKADPRFRVTDTFQEKKLIRPRVSIRRSDAAMILRQLTADFGPVRNPASWSVADCFQAAVRFLRGEEIVKPGYVYGFLEKPQGVAASVKVRRADLIAAAKAIDLGTFLPASIDVGGVKIGPADFLFAALAVVAGKDEVTVTPREQLGSFKDVPGFDHLDIKGGWCIHSPDMNGELLDERLKLQLWTLRFE